MTVLNSDVVSKKRSTRLIRSQSGRSAPCPRFSPLPCCAKNRQILTYFPLSSGSDAEVSHLSTTALLCTPFLRRHAFPDTKTVTNVTHCPPSGRRQSRSAGFTYLSCTIPLFCTSYKSKNNFLNQIIRTRTKNKPLRCTYRYEKSCTYRDHRL